MSRKRNHKRASRHGYYTEGLMRKEKELKKKHLEEATNLAREVGKLIRARDLFRAKKLFRRGMPS